jgi:RNA polymerase sigma factor (sigma-70 family)
MNGNDELEKLRNDPRHFEVVYKNYREGSFRWLKKYHQVTKEVIEDVYQDAVLVLLEKSRNPEFELTASVQTYLNSICRNQLLAKYRRPGPVLIPEPSDFDQSITDWFDYNEYSEEKEERLSLLERAFEQFRMKNEKCYQILKMQYYDKFEMSKIAELVGLSNSNSAKTQANKCRGKLYDLIHVAN